MTSRVLYTNIRLVIISTEALNFLLIRKIYVLFYGFFFGDIQETQYLIKDTLDQMVRHRMRVRIRNLFVTL